MITSAFGAAGGAVLKKSFHPRSSAMGDAYTAVADDAYSIYINPAGLSYLNQSEVFSSFSSGMTDDYLGQLSYVNAGHASHTWGIGILTYSGGKFDLVDYYGATQELEAQQDWLLSLASAYRFTGFWRMGMTLEILYSTLLEDYHAATAAVNIGSSFNLLPELRLDAVVRHLGLPLQYSYDNLGLPFQDMDTQDALPLTGAVGLSYRILGNNLGMPDHSLLLAADMEVGLDSHILGRFGLEYAYLKFINLRAGYKLNHDLEWLSLGAGFRYPVLKDVVMKIDYAFSLSQALNNQHRVSLSMLTAPNPARKEGAQILVLKPVSPYTLSAVKIGFGVDALGYTNLVAISGLNVEFMASNYFALFLGAGSTVGVGFPEILGNAGIRFYLGPPRVGFRGRITLKALQDFTYPVTFVSSSLGFQWRFLEGLSLDADVGPAICPTYPEVIFINAGIGLTVHIAGAKQPEIVKKESPDSFADIASYKKIIPHPVALERGSTSSARAEVVEMRGVYLKNVKILKMEDGNYRVLGSIFNKSGQDVKHLELRIDYWDVAGNSLGSSSHTLIKTDEDKSGNQILKDGFLRDFAFSPGIVPAGFEKLSVTITDVEYDTDTQKSPVGSSGKVTAKLGAGIGLPYGITGGNMELMFSDIFGVHAGLGSFSPVFGVDKMSWQIGARIYLLAPENPLRLRFGIGVGPAKLVMLIINGILSDYEIINGFHPSAGLEWKFTDFMSLDLDVEYVLPTESKVRLSGSYFGGTYNRTVPIENYFSGAVGIKIHFGVSPSKKNSDMKIK